MDIRGKENQSVKGNWGVRREHGAGWLLSVISRKDNNITCGCAVKG